MLLLCLTSCTTTRYANVDLRLPMETSGYILQEGPLENITLRTLGEPGQGFEGTLILDGVSQPISGLTPFERSYSARIFIMDAAKQDQFGTIQFELTTDSGLYSAGTLKSKGGRCRFGYHRGQIEVRAIN